MSAAPVSMRAPRSQLINNSLKLAIFLFRFLFYFSLVFDVDQYIYLKKFAEKMWYARRSTDVISKTVVHPK